MMKMYAKTVYKLGQIIHRDPHIEHVMHGAWIVF